MIRCPPALPATPHTYYAVSCRLFPLAALRACSRAPVLPNPTAPDRQEIAAYIPWEPAPALAPAPTPLRVYPAPEPLPNTAFHAFCSPKASFRNTLQETA